MLALLGVLASSALAAGSKEPKSVTVTLQTKWEVRAVSFRAAVAALPPLLQSTPLALEAAEFLSDQDERDVAFWAFAGAWKGERRLLRAPHSRP